MYSSLSNFFVNPKALKVIVFDVDDTLVHASDPSFYKNYALCVENAIAQYFAISLDMARTVATKIRSNGLGAEQALFTGDISAYLDGASPKQPDFELLHTAMSNLNPKGKFFDRSEESHLLNVLRHTGLRVIALTSSPVELAEKILRESGYKMDNFDELIGYTPDNSPPKMRDNGVAVFSAIVKKYKISPDELLAVGDKYEYDVRPAEMLGAHGFVVPRDVEKQDDVTPVRELLKYIIRKREEA